MKKAQKFCPECKSTVGGFAFCPKCGGKTEELTRIEITSGETTDSHSENSTQLALWCHLAPLLITVIAALTSIVAIGFFLALVAWVPPLVIKSQKPNDEFIVKHAKESFNFQIFWLITIYALLAVYLVFGIITLGIGLILGFLIILLLIIPYVIFVMVVQIKACIAASGGKEYKYPLVLFRVMK